MSTSGVLASPEPLPDLILRLHREGYAEDQIAAELLALDRIEEADAAGINIAAVIADGVPTCNGGQA